MAFRFSVLHKVAAAAAFALTVSAASANVYIDEDFETLPIFNQGTTVDPYDGTGGAATAGNITQTGARITSPSFRGAAAYELDPTETISVSSGYVGATGGNFAYYQFALALDSIPAAGAVARFEYNVTLDSTAHRFFIDLTSTGTQVDVTGGEDLAVNSSGAITTITTADTWTFITCQVNLHNAAANDNRPQVNQLGVAPGVYFYADSTTPASSVAITGGANKASAAWFLTADAGTTAKVYVDDLYWELGMDTDFDATPTVGTDRGDLQPFDSAPASSSVGSWELYDN